MPPEGGGLPPDATTGFPSIAERRKQEGAHPSEGTLQSCGSHDTQCRRERRIGGHGAGTLLRTIRRQERWIGVAQSMLIERSRPDPFRSKASPIGVFVRSVAARMWSTPVAASTATPSLRMSLM